MKIAIDLLWLRPMKVGGTESYIRNLLYGFIKLEDDFEFALLVAKNTTNTFVHYSDDNRISILEVDIDNSNIGRRILWQFTHESYFLRKHGIKYCFIPVYCRPVFNGGVQYINVIHDIQAYHYAKYHPLHEVVYSKLMWWCDIKFSKGLVCISEFVKKDLMEVYKVKNNDIKVIYDPITIDKSDVVGFDVLKEKYDIDEYQYYYTVSQLIPHKNLNTLVEIFDILNQKEPQKEYKLLISGVNGNAAKELKKKLEERSLQDIVILTGFVSNSIRNTLYKYCRVFLFPSIFEGFGMPPVEAMYMGRPVLTTRCASIPEVTQNKAEYVDNPYDVDEWCEKILGMRDNFQGNVNFELYDAEILAKSMLEVIFECFENTDGEG